MQSCTGVLCERHCNGRAVTAQDLCILCLSCSESGGLSCCELTETTQGCGTVDVPAVKTGTPLAMSYRLYIPDSWGGKGVW